MNSKNFRKILTSVLAIIVIISALSVPAFAVAKAKSNDTPVWSHPDMAGMTQYRTAILMKDDKLNGTSFAWSTILPTEMYVGNMITYCARDPRVEKFISWGHTALFNY